MSRDFLAAMSGVIFVADRFHRVPIGRDAELSAIVVACVTQQFGRSVRVVEPLLQEFDLRFDALEFVDELTFERGQVHELQGGEVLCLFDGVYFFFHVYRIPQDAQKASDFFMIM